MPRMLKLLDRTEEILASLCLAAMCVIIGLQVFNRYVLGSSLVWAEELGRYLFIWSVFVGCSYAAKERRHLEVTILKNLVGDRVRRVITAIAYLLTLAFCGFAVVWGVGMVRSVASTGQETPALEVSAVWVFIALPIGMALMGFRIVQHLLSLWRGDYPEPDAGDASS